MTNFKIKTMFCVLYALLTADFVYSRPYNETDLVLNTPTNVTNANQFRNYDNITESRTEETLEQTNKNSKTDMEAILNAEQGRDELILSKNNLKEPDKVLEIPVDDATAIEKQMNTSSPLLEEIIDSETGREETLTDIMFRPAIMPRFEFLISLKLNDTNTSDNSDLKNTSDVLKKTDFVELVAVEDNMRSDNKSAYNLANITGFEVDDDVAPDTSFNDLQTLILACLGTLVPLLGVLCATLFIRCLCRRCCPGCCKKKSSDCSDSETSEQKTDINHQQLKSPQKDSLSTVAEGLETSSPPANGSIITMTLKNNHLIVETEERNDITKNGRETKMKYSPENDGIFVVEVQQSTAYRPASRPPLSPPQDPQISTNQALIHRVPEEIETSLSKISSMEEDSDKSDRCERPQGLTLSNTGLSISDLSLSSVSSHNTYAYGNQVGYEQSQFGYPIYAGYEVPNDEVGGEIIHDNSKEPLICRTPTDPDKPIVTAAIFKQDSIIIEALPEPYCLEGSTDGPLLSDVQARETSLQQLHDQMEKKIENGFISASPKKLKRADTLPYDVENNKTPDHVKNNNGMPTIEEDYQNNKEIFKNKRASLPIIRTEMYDSVKQVFVPTGSPKFEKFNNDISPDNIDNPPTMITITEEVDNHICDNDSS